MVTSRFTIAGTYDINSMKERMLGLRRTIPGIEEILVRTRTVVEFHHSSSVSVTQIENALKALGLRTSIDRSTSGRNE
ncbi:hypothetical protein SUGI_1078050 [Cryptomeria japonica]|nr:hypothetical protein SUGI_1078050 [Cryptomeria japonica]